MGEGNYFCNAGCAYRRVLACVAYGAAEIDRALAQPCKTRLLDLVGCTSRVAECLSDISAVLPAKSVAAKYPVGPGDSSNKIITASALDIERQENLPILHHQQATGPQAAGPPLGNAFYCPSTQVCPRCIYSTTPSSFLRLPSTWSMTKNMVNELKKGSYAIRSQVLPSNWDTYRLAQYGIITGGKSQDIGVTCARPDGHPSCRIDRMTVLIQRHQDHGLKTE